MGNSNSSLGHIIRPEEAPFNISDPGFYLDVKLDAIVNGSSYDFTGKKIFSVEFFRQGIGFGITNIDIEVNTSLQPVITITMKDLYGNTVFGKNINTGLQPGLEQAGANYSVLFNWPPPKFLFTFKGFLGEQVSWILNLKKTSTTYQSDGSYDVKCEFVPNQWGFMADLPFLYLLAVKGLKKKELSAEDFKKAVTIFDLIKIGKQVEVKTKETTKEFDTLLKQMTLLKANRIVEAVVVSKVIKFGEKIDGSVNNLKVAGFTPVTINQPKDPNLGSTEAITSFTSQGSENLRRANAYLLLTSNIGAFPPLPGLLTVSQLSFQTQGTGSSAALTFAGNPVEDKVNERLKTITDNIGKIENAIKQKSYQSNKTQLQQLTIGEIFKHLSSDAGYVMGKILQAGYKSYIKNKDARDALDKELIGKQFPMIIDSEGKEVPAIGKGIGVETGEIAFVDDFITAITEGIANDLLKENQTAAAGNQENALTKRINNLEAIRGNPYAPAYRTIAENIFVRSGIMSYLTRSNDPNLPGTYTNNTGMFARDSVEEVIQLASADMENISTGMLSSIPSDEFLQLKNFCLFWTKFLSTDGKSLLKEDGSVQSPIDSFLSLLGGNVNGTLNNYGVVIDKDAEGNPTITKTLSQIVSEVFSPKQSGTTLSLDASNANFINPDTLQSQRVFNNGIIYSVPLNSGGDYVFALFNASDATKAKEVNNSPSDAEAKNDDADDPEKANEPMGFVAIDTFKNTKGETLGRVEIINDYLADGLVLDYTQVSNPSQDLFKFKTQNTFQGLCVYLASTQIVESSVNIQANNIAAKNLAYSVTMMPLSDDSGLVFGPFYNTNSARNQRACLVKMCSDLLQKMTTLEEEKNQIISEVLGKATEQREGLYKQMHVLYNQWESLMFEDPKNSSDAPSATAPNENNIAQDLSKRYIKGTSHNSTNTTQVGAFESNSFIYDYPLNKKANINVANSIINIEPLYKPNGNTTVLNIIQQICTKNNFVFVPIPGNGDFTSYDKIFVPHVSTSTSLKNLFYVMFAATPESRSKVSNQDDSPISYSNTAIDKIPQDAYEVRVGSVDNKIFKGVTIDTNENKTTAESIVNLQRLVDKENQNKTVTTDCSMLPVMEGRSYKASFDMLGNAQVFPMQYFYLNSIPLFNGLYQVLKVKHNIKPNDMTTTAEGIRMRFNFNNGDFGGIPPVTLETLGAIDAIEGVKPDYISMETLNQNNDHIDNTATTAEINERLKNTKSSDGTPTFASEKQRSGGVLYEPVHGYVSNDWLDNIKKHATKEERKQQLLKIQPPVFNIPMEHGSFTSPFGSRTVVKGHSMHPGIDVSNGLGTPVYTIAAGVVVQVTANGGGGGYGNSIIIKHNDRFYSLYGHLNKTIVKKGDTVQAAQQIGEEGNTEDGKIAPHLKSGKMGAHLHFEIRDFAVSEYGNGKYGSVNPQFFVYKSVPTGSRF